MMNFSNIIIDMFTNKIDKLIFHFFYLFFLDIIYIWNKICYLLIYDLFGFNIINQISSIKNYRELDTNMCL